MKRILLFFTLGSILNGYSQGNPNPNPLLDAAIQSEMNAENFPGVSTVIVKDGEIIWLESYGFADIENNIPVEDSTVFLLASMSKLFTGTAIMQLYQNGIINLDEDINNYISFTIDVPNFEADSVTFRQLMTHTASIEDNGIVMDTYYDYPDPSISLYDCVSNYFSVMGTDYDAVNNFHNNAPGSFYDYSNMGTALNGYMVEAITGQFFNDFCDSAIFDPLCMNKTAWFMADFDSNHVARPYQYVAGNYIPYNHYGFADYPDGQLRSNVKDLAHFMVAYLNSGLFNGNSILNSSSINEMWTIHNAGLDPFQGLNWYQEEIFYDGGANSNMLWGHNGGENGVSTDMYLDPANNIGICVLTNGEGDALFICDELYDYALSLTPANSITPQCETAHTDEEDDLQLQIFPNPVTNNVHLNSNKDLTDAEVNIFDLHGRNVLRYKCSTYSAILDVSHLKPGCYVVQIQSSDFIIEKKLLVQ